jgi:plastocyanin
MNKHTYLFINYSLRSSFIILFSCLIFSCAKDSVNPPANEVYLSGSAFSPTTITVTVNTTIKWTNKDGIAHTVTSDSGLFDSGNMNSNTTYSHQFTAAGSFNYHCAYHSMMTGTVIVH